MRVAIVYATRYGSTRTVAEQVAERVDGEVLLGDLSNRSGRQIAAGSEVVVIGSPVYSGRVPMPVRRFVAGARDLLATKHVVLFMTSFYTGARAEAQLADNFPAWIVAQSRSHHFVGGRIEMSRLRRLDSFVLRRIGMVSKDVDTISVSAIDELTVAINRL